MLKSSISCRLVALCLFVVCGLSSAGLAQAAETVKKYKPNDATFVLNEYSRKTSTIDLVYSNDQGGDAAAVVSCGNPTTGSWAVTKLTGRFSDEDEAKCYDFEFCYEARTDKVTEILEGALAGKVINSVTVKPDTEGKVSTICYQITKIMNHSDVAIAQTSQCSGGAYLSPSEKGLCVFDEDRSGGNTQVIANTGDDMFKMLPSGGFATNGAFVEYPKTGGLGNPTRLNWVERGSGPNSSKSVMIPAGPKNTYSDFLTFMRNPPAPDVRTEDACYPVRTAICEALPPPPKPPTPGLCGPAHGRSITSGTIPPRDRCYVGNPSEIVQSGSVFNWSCRGLPDDGSQSTDHCSAQITGEIYRPDVPPNGEVEPPSSYCFFHVSGGLISNAFQTGWFTQIGTADEYSNLVGPGNYNQAQPFARAHSTTFDGIAIGRDTHVTIYGGPNYTGRVILDSWGPLVLNNHIWQGQIDNSWQTSAWPGEFHGQFPPSSRHWSSENMHPWGAGTSLKVECAAECVTPSPSVESKWLPTSAACPAGQEGTNTWQYEEARTAYCPSPRGSYAWGNWAATGKRQNEVNTCAVPQVACKPHSPSSETRWLNGSQACPAGQEGSHTWEYAESRTSTCPTQFGSPTWSGWSVTGAKRSEVNTCKVVDELPRPDPAPPGETAPPSSYCFFHVSGVLISNAAQVSWYSEIGKTDQYSNMVGPGNYPQAQPFARAHQFTFDGIAFGRDTRVTIYGGPNFTGRVILDSWGPAVINNTLFKGTAPNAEGWRTSVWPGTFQSQFPPSTRQWSSENMHPWGSGTSLKVECR